MFQSPTLDSIPEHIFSYLHYLHVDYCFSHCALWLKYCDNNSKVEGNSLHVNNANIDNSLSQKF